MGSRQTSASSVTLSEKVGVHDPSFPGFRLGPYPFDVVRAFAQIALHEDLVLCADIGTPIDIDARIVDRLERTISVEHDDYIVHVVRQPFGKLAARRDLNGSPNSIERYSVSRRQSLDRADAGNDLILERDSSSGDDLLNDPECAVVERRVAPDQKSTTLVFAQFVADQPLVNVRSLLVPRSHGRLIR